MAISVAATPITIGAIVRQPVIHHTPANPRDTGLDQTLYITPDTITLVIKGVWANSVWVAEPIVITLDVGPNTATPFSVHFATHPIITLDLSLSYDYVTLEVTRKNWVKWSKIGTLDFTIEKDNLAGERPIDWKGWIYAIKKLGNKVVVYGQGGVTFLTASSYSWGMTTATRIGVRDRLAVCGTDSVQFYVNADHMLCRVSGEKFDILDYHEYLEHMGSIVLSYDESTGHVYICDGSTGYVYSDKDKSMGRGPANITGIGKQAGSTYVVASGSLVYLPFEICTDIYDLGSRKDKTILEIEFGVDAAVEIYAAIDWRKDKTVAFQTTPWTIVNPNGRANLPCWGREFRIRAKQLTYEYFELDYIKVLGQLHNYSYLDSFLRGRQV